MQETSLPAEIGRAILEAADAGEQAQRLLEKAQFLSDNDPGLFISLADPLIESPRAADDPGCLALLLRYRSSARFQLSQRGAGRDDLLQALELAESAGDDDILAELLAAAGQMHRSGGDLHVALEYFERALSLLNVKHDKRIVILQNIAGSQAMLGKYDQALKMLNEALTLAREKGPGIAMSAIYSSIGIVQGHLRQHERSLESFNLALRSVSAERNSNAEGRILINMAIAHSYVHPHSDAVIDCLCRARELLEACSDVYNQGLVSGKLFDEYWKRGDIAAAAKECAIVTELADKCAQPDLLGTAKACQAILQAERGRLAEALTVALEAVQINREHKAPYEELNNLRLVVSICREMGDYRKASDYLQLQFDLQLKLNRENYEKSLAESQSRLDLESAQHQRQLAEREAEIATLKSEQLKQQVEATHNQITIKALLISQKTDLLIEVKRAVRAALEVSQDKAEGLLRQLLQTVDVHLADASGWEQFEEQFSLLHPTFLNTMAERYTEISLMERRVCALMKLKFTSKDICRILGIAQRSVETYRYRIRKKLKLAGSDDLSTFLHSIE